MYVAASSRCFATLPLDAALTRLVDLEYSCVEITLHENGGHVKPSQVLADFSAAYAACRKTQRLAVVAYSVDIESRDASEYYRQFEAICRLAKASKVITLVVRAGLLGTPFNEEIERLRKMVAIAANEGAVIGLLTESGRLTHDAATTKSLCDNVPGLGVTLDPSHLMLESSQPKIGSLELLLPKVVHLRLRDSTTKELQVRIGQGEVEYGKLVGQLEKVKYANALCVDLATLPDVDQNAEMRKMRLLLESLL